MLLKRTGEIFPSSTVMPVSAVSGEGIDRWLEDVLIRTDAGQRIVTVDYDIYAHGEAALGWLNGSVRLKGDTVDWDAFLHIFLSRLAQRFDEAGYGVGHVKAILENDSLYIIGNLTGKAQTLSFRNSAGTGDTAKLIINARVGTSPEKLDALVREVLNETTRDRYESTVLAWRCLQPGRPNPTYRFAQVISIKYNNTIK
jgi:hypothetical protein